MNTRARSAYDLSRSTAGSPSGFALLAKAERQRPRTARRPRRLASYEPRPVPRDAHPKDFC